MTIRKLRPRLSQRNLPNKKDDTSFLPEVDHSAVRRVSKIVY